MNALLEPLQQIARDLVAKKLWPVAVLLLAAVVAVPVLIGSSSQEAPAPAPVAAVAPGASAANSLVTVAEQAVTGKDDRPGKVQDPFYDPPARPAAASASAASAAAPAATSHGGGTSGAGASAGGTPSAAAPAQTTPPQTTPQPTAPVTASVHYRTQVRWHEVTPGRPRPLVRLTPLGGRVEPAALYLGVTKSTGSYAVFLLGANATSDGDADCEDDTNCRVIALKSGQKQIITVHPADGGAVRRYHLDVVSVRALTTDAAAARRMRLKVHADGRDVMREMWQHRPTAEALGPIRYDRDRGLLVKTVAAAAATQQPGE